MRATVGLGCLLTAAYVEGVAVGTVDAESVHVRWEQSCQLCGLYGAHSDICPRPAGLRIRRKSPLQRRSTGWTRPWLRQWSTTRTG